jgi:hypothetical protein
MDSQQGWSSSLGWGLTISHCKKWAYYKMLLRTSDLDECYEFTSLVNSVWMTTLSVMKCFKYYKVCMFLK